MNPQAPVDAVDKHQRARYYLHRSCIDCARSWPIKRAPLACPSCRRPTRLGNLETVFRRAVLRNGL